MDQTRAINALAPFVALAKSANSPLAAAQLIEQATSAPNTYIFAELLQQPNIQSLSGNDRYGSSLTLLECFAWGTWETYKNSTPALPLSSEAQALKLRLLSLLTIAAEKPSSPTSLSSSSNLSYTSLCQRLDLASPLELEQLVTTAIYRNLLTATLDPAAQTVIVTSVAPLRDLAPGRVTGLVTELEAWRARCDAVLLALDAEIRKVHADAEKRARREAAAEKQIKAALDAGEKGGSSSSSASSGATGGPLGVVRGAGNARGPAGKREPPSGNNEDDDGGDDPMDVDASGSGGTTGGRKRGAGSGGLMSRFTRGSGR